MRFLPLIAVAIVLFLGVGGARAQGGDAATADRLFREGRALMKDGHYEQACSKLEESHRLDPAPGTAINLGDCFEKVGKVASALLAYQAGRDLLQPGDPRVHPVKQQITALEKRTPRLTIKLAPGAPDGTKVKRDGRTVEATKLGVLVALNPGKYKIIVTAPGRETARFNVTLAEGQTRELVVEAGEAIVSNDARAKEGEPTTERRAGSSQPGSPAQVPGNDGTKTTGLMLGGVGIAAVVFGGIAFYETKQYEQEAQRAFDRGAYDAKKDKFAAAERWNTAGIVSLAVGGAAIITGGVLWLSAEGGSTSARRRNLRMACTASPNVGVLVVEGNW